MSYASATSRDSGSGRFSRGRVDLHRPSVPEAGTPHATRHGQYDHRPTVWCRGAMLFYAPCALRRELRYGNAASGRSCGCAPRVCPGIGCRPCRRKTDTSKHPSAIPSLSALPALSASLCRTESSSPRQPPLDKPPLFVPLSPFPAEQFTPRRPGRGTKKAHPPQRIWFPVRKKLLSAVLFVIICKIYLV